MTLKFRCRFDAELGSPQPKTRRHHDLQLLETRELKHREWSKWSMNQASLNEQNAAVYLKYSTTADFNPYLMSAESARGLMTELSVQRS